MARDKTPKPSVWIFMVDPGNTQDMKDLDHLDEILWGSNPHTKKGDIVLMYRQRPYCDIAYVFSAISNPRRKERARLTVMDHVIELGEKSRLSNPVTLNDIRSNPQLSDWSFKRQQQGAMRQRMDIREEGYWPHLRALIVHRNPHLSATLDEVEGLKKLSKGRSTRGRKPVRDLRVFISYSSHDIDKVRELYKRLKLEPSLDVWFDKKSLDPGDTWEYEIDKAIRMSDVILICLSAGSVQRRGFSQREITWALKKADEQPEGTTSILPVKLEECNVPARLARVVHIAELFNNDGDGYERIIAALRKRAASLEMIGTQ